MTRDGVREIWGRDIQRAVAKSLTQPQIGDEVVPQRTGRDAVTVKRQERDPGGPVPVEERGGISQQLGHRETESLRSARHGRADRTG